MRFIPSAKKVQRAILVKRNEAPYLVFFDDRDSKNPHSCLMVSINKDCGFIVCTRETFDNSDQHIAHPSESDHDFIRLVEEQMEIHVELASQGAIGHHILMEVAHVMWADTWARELEEHGVSMPSGADIFELAPRLDDVVQASIIYPVMRDIESNWGVAIELVFNKMGLQNEDDKIQALSHLLLGCAGHGVSITDDFDQEFQQAQKELGLNLSTTPVRDLEMNPWFEIGYLDRAIREVSEDNED